MKKMLLLAAAAMMGTASFAGKTDITEICKITEVEGTNTFAPEAEYYYVIYCGEETMGQLGIDEGNSMNFLGLEGSNLDIWPNGESVEWRDTPDLNSFGVAGEYQNPTCAAWAELWYGGGWMVPATQADAVKAIPSDAKLHLCVSSMTPGKEQINLNSNGNEANIILDFGGTLKADGTWYNIELSLEDLLDKADVDYKEFTGGYVASFNQGGDCVVGMGFCWDSFFFYGGKPEATGIETVKAETNVNAPVYNLAGQRVAKNYKGIAIQNGKKFIVK